MGKTSIEWTRSDDGTAGYTWNPVSGCSKVSLGCTNCYAEKLSHRFKMTDKPWNATFATQNVQLHLDRLNAPLRWRKQRRVFVNSMSDLFHELVPFEFIEQVFSVMEEADWHTYQVLTKRPQRMLQFMIWYATRSSDGSVGHTWYPKKHIWLGVSVENQQAADERIPLLLQTPAAVRFLSCEPLLGSVDLTQIHLGTKTTGYGPRKIVWDALRGWEHQYSSDRQFGAFPNTSISRDHPIIDWVIVGGESGPNARPMHPDWVRSLRDQCTAAGVAFFFKQWGEWAPFRSLSELPDHEIQAIVVGDETMWHVCKKKAGRIFDGRTWDEFPKIEYVSL